MEKVLKEVNFLVGELPDQVDVLIRQHSFEIFSNDTVNFLSDISDNLLKCPEVKKYPDVATFAFYCRTANLNSLKRAYCSDDNLRIGRGIIFHITPGNVPVNFAYSLFTGLITGNINIVRVPSKYFEQVNLIVRSIQEVLQQDNYFKIFSKRIFIVQYDRESNATSLFSSFCDVRIIWGGDNTINEIRKAPILPKSTEVTFSDRYSISIIHAVNYLNFENKTRIAQNFYNDTYLFDQNACTSPQTICWMGTLKDVDKAKKVFWEEVQNVLNDKGFDLQPVISIDKLTTFYAQAISYGNISRPKQVSNEIWRVNNKKINNDIELFRCSSGYFNEIIISSLDDLLPAINRKYQTIGYFGVSKEEFKNWLKKSKPLGIDRIVPIGRTMDFSMTWDGYDLVQNLSRQIPIT